MSEKRKRSSNVSDLRRVLKFLQVLKKHSGSNNRLKQADIMKALLKDKETDHSCDSKTLRKALRELILVINPPPQSLTEQNRDRFVIRYKGWDSGAIPARLTDIFYKPYIEVSEMQAIADGIGLLDTLSREQKKRLIGKLEEEYKGVGFDCEGKVSVFAVDDSEALTLNTALIAQAALKCLEITFKFGGYDRNGEIVPRREKDGSERIYRAVPYYVAGYRGKRYMLCCYIRSDSEYTENVSIYRVDLMRDITVTDKRGRMINAMREFKNTNAHQYMQQHPDMNYGAPITVTLKVRAEFYTLIHDNFGMSYEFAEKLDDTFDRITVTASEDGIIGLAVAYPDRIEVLRPQTLREKIAKRAAELTDMYEVRE